MARQSSTAGESRSLVRVPSNAVAYVAIAAALITAAIHLLLAPRVIGFDRMQGLLFYLNGLGFVAGVLLYLTRYWRRSFYLVAVGYALATILAFFAMGGRISQFAVLSKAAEAVVAVAAAYLYVSDRPA